MFRKHQFRKAFLDHTLGSRYRALIEIYVVLPDNESRIVSRNWTRPNNKSRKGGRGSRNRTQPDNGFQCIEPQFVFASQIYKILSQDQIFLYTEAP
jgi:hypothetical protein